MNDRLLELAKIAGLKAKSETKLSPQEQKFAELIVMECSRCITEPTISAEPPYDKATKHAVIVLVDDMQNYFGIE